MNTITKKQKIWISLFIGGTMLLLSMTFYFYQLFFTANVLLGKKDKVLIIPSNTEFKKLADLLVAEEYIADRMSFMFVSKMLNYQEKVKAGRYILRSGMSNLQVVRLLRSGAQDPVKVTFNNVRLKKDLASKITRNLEIDSLEVEKWLNDPQKTAELGFDTTTIMAMFIPNTYEMYWTSSADQLLKKMQAEYQKFWNEDRKAKAKAQNLTPIQVSILASIVEAETKKHEEAPIIAGVYLNRLAQGEKLQADPTVIFGIGDFGIKRLLISHLQYDSPYNTYKYNGLPPGLINLPSVPSLEAVLNPQKHDYIFFCAKEDFSGYHNFAVSYNDHLKNAARYQAALNKLNIK